MKRSDWLAGAVMAWTTLLTVFTWTATMRGFWRPDMFTWALFGLRGEGRGGWYWIFPVLALLALLLFYLEGRGRGRFLVSVLVLLFNLPVTVAACWVSVTAGERATLQGPTWGRGVPLPFLLAPLVVFSGLALVWVLRERRATAPALRGWGEVHWARLLAALTLMLPMGWSFSRAQGYDNFSKLAIACAILQWVFLIGGVQPPPRTRGSGDTAKSA